MALTLSQIIAVLSNRFGFYVSGTATSGSTSTLIDATNLIQPANSLVGHYLYMLTGTAGNIGKERPITAFAQSSGTLTVSPTFASSVAAADTFEVKPLPDRDFTDAIAAAVRSAGKAWLVTVDSTTAITLTGAGDYALPAACVDVISAWITSGAGEYVPVKAFEVSGTLGTKRIVFHDYALAKASGYVRLWYTALPTVPSTRTSTLGVSDETEREFLEYVVDYGLYYLHDLSANRMGTGESRVNHAERASFYLQIANAVRASVAGSTQARRTTVTG